MNNKAWDKLNLKLDDIDKVKILLASGTNEKILYELMVSASKNGYVKGSSDLFTIIKNTN